MENETNQDLLVIITMQEDEPVAANKAFRVFYHRLYRYVKFVAWKLTASIKKDREAVAADIVTDTFRDVFHNYKSKGYFDPQKCKDIEKGIRNWLSGIARNHLLRYLEEIAKISKPISYLDSWPDHLFFEFDDQESIPPPPNLKALNAALDTLDDKQREILLISVQFEEEGSLPPKIKQILCRVHGISPNSLRQTKKRAKEKVIDFLQRHGYFSTEKIKKNA